MNKKAWDQLHSLLCNLEYFIQERDSRPETVNSKHAWDMILAYVAREIKDVKELLKIGIVLEDNKEKYNP